MHKIKNLWGHRLSMESNIRITGGWSRNSIQRLHGIIPDQTNDSTLGGIVMPNDKAAQRLLNMVRRRV